jgi:hypothetical protein
MPGMLDGETANPACHSMFKTPEKKDFPPVKGGTLTGNGPTFFDVENPQMVSPAKEYLPRTLPLAAAR